MSAIDYWKKFYKFMNEDTWLSFVATLVIAFVLIKFLFFPGLSFLTGTALPLVIVESCSMYHDEKGFEDVFSDTDYKSHGLSLGESKPWDFQNGFSKGDVIFVVGVSEPEVGDVIIFDGGQNHPIIHRVVSVGDGTYTTKGDNNDRAYSFDTGIKSEAVIGKALFKVPAVGWAKLIFFESRIRDQSKKGLC